MNLVFLDLSFGGPISMHVLPKQAVVTADVLGNPGSPLMLILTSLIPNILFSFPFLGFPGPNNLVDSFTTDEI